MPKHEEARLTTFTGARISVADMAKLEAIAKATQRPVADVIRVLIRDARVREPDIVADPVGPRDAEEAALMRRGSDDAA